MKNKFIYIENTPAHGKIFKKGKIEIVIYSNGGKRYFPYGIPGKCWHREKNGMDFNFYGLTQ